MLQHPGTGVRMRCLTVGCNPVLDETTAAEHAQATGHRTAKWPVRSADGQKKARKRNRTGYYRKYNVGNKSPYARGIDGYGADTVSSYEDGIHPHSSEAFE